MKHKTRKLLSILIALVMIVGLMPATASAADSYTLTVTGGKAYDSGDNVITSAKPGDMIYIEPDAVPGKHVTSWTASPGVTFIRNEAYAEFTMPAKDVSLTPVYADQTPYDIDLSGGGSVNVDWDAFWALIGIYCSSMTTIASNDPININLDSSGNNDIAIMIDGYGTTTMEKLTAANLTGTYSVTQPNAYKYSPINIKFDNSGSTEYNITVNGGKAYSNKACTTEITKAAVGTKVYLKYNTPAANQYVESYTVNSPDGVDIKWESSFPYMHSYVMMPGGDLTVTVNTAARSEYTIDLTKGAKTVPWAAFSNEPLDFGKLWLLNGTMDLDDDGTADISYNDNGDSITVTITPLPTASISGDWSVTIPAGEPTAANTPYSKVTYKFPGTTPILKITRVDFTVAPPKIGDNPSNKADIATTPAGGVVSPEYTNVKWFESDTPSFPDTLDPMSPTDTFKEGKYYKARMSAEPTWAPGYLYVDFSTKIYINGKEVTDSPTIIFGPLETETYSISIEPTSVSLTADEGYNADEVYQDIVATSTGTGTVGFIMAGFKEASMNERFTLSVGGMTATVKPKSGLTKGTYNATVVISDSSDRFAPIEVPVTFTVEDIPIVGNYIAITGKTFPNGTVGTAYTGRLDIIGTKPIDFEIAEGSLPDGLTLVPQWSDQNTDIVVQGTPTRTGTFKFKIKATNVHDSKTTEEISVTISPRSSGGGGGGSSSASYAITAEKSENGTVKLSRTGASKGARVTVTPQPNEGYETEKITVTDKDGKEITVSKNSDGTFSFTMPSSKVSVVPTFKKTEGVDPVKPEPIGETPLLVVTIDKTSYQLNGQAMTMDSAPFIDGNDRTMLPVRVIANALGISNENISWNKDTKTASFTRADGKVVSCTVNSNIIKIGDEEVEIDTVPVIRNDRIYLPMRALFNAFNVPNENILWDAAARTVTVMKKD